MFQILNFQYVFYRSLAVFIYFIKVQKNVISAMFFPGRQIFFFKG